MKNAQFMTRLFPVKLSFPGVAIRARGLNQFCILAWVCVASLSCSPESSGRIQAQDWPQILGPNRDGSVSLPAPISADWPNQLKPAWTATIGSGYSGAAISRGLVFIAHREANQEKLLALDLATGKNVWEAAWKASYSGRINPDAGPRAVPAIQDGKVVCYGAAGDLVCVRAQDGQILWQRNLRQEYDAEDGYFGAGSSPLIVDGKVIACPGGNDAGVVAVDLSNGKTIWKATQYDASYSSPILIDDGNRKLLLIEMRLNTVLLDLQSGEVLGDIKFGGRGPTVNAATPLSVGNGAYLLTASYNIGTTIVSVVDEKLVAKASGLDLISSQYNSPVAIGELVFGINGREDGGIATLRAIDVSSKTVLWEKDDIGVAHLLKANNQILVVGLDRRLRLVEANGAEYREQATTMLPDALYRALPAISGSRLVLRATFGADSGEIYCFELPLEK